MQMEMAQAMTRAGLTAPPMEQIMSNLLGLDANYCYIFANYRGHLDAYLYNPTWNKNNHVWHHYAMKPRTSPGEWNCSRHIRYIGAKALLFYCCCVQILSFIIDLWRDRSILTGSKLPDLLYDRRVHLRL